MLLSDREAKLEWEPFRGTSPHAVATAISSVGLGGEAHLT